MLLARVAEGLELAVGFLAVAVADARKTVYEPADEAGLEVARVNVGLAVHDIVPQQYEVGDRCQTLRATGAGVGDDAMALIVDAVRAVKIGEALRIVGREEAKRFEPRVKLFQRARPKTQSIERQPLGDFPTGSAHPHCRGENHIGDDASAG
jgi:hypothetical protein